MEPLAHNETTIWRPIGWRFFFCGCAPSEAGISPSVTSTQDGMRIACTAPTTQMAAVNHNAPDESKTPLIPAAIAPKTPPATSPNTVSLAFVLDSVISGGSTRGVTEDFSTMNDLDSTILPSAAGYRPQSSKCSAMNTHISA